MTDSAPAPTPEPDEFPWDDLLEELPPLETDEEEE